MRHQFTQDQCRRGGKNVAKQPGGKCAFCDREFKSHAALAGHLGLHGFADRFAAGNIKEGRMLFVLTGAAASDPFPNNGAFAEGHKILEQIQSTK